METPDGTKYTRKGNFTTNEQGNLCTQEGYPVLGNGGQITITHPDVMINEIGDITVNGDVVDTLKIVAFEKTDLMKDGNGLFSKTQRKYYRD